RPRILLPESANGWPDARLAAVLAHEREHALRGDPLVQWLALLNRAIFWFHPLAWWLGHKLSGLAEESCDAPVLAQGPDPQAYCESLLEFARAVSREGARVPALGMAMPGAFLSRRVRLLLSGTTAARISRARMAWTAVVSVTVAAIIAAGTLVH